jgi:hypothetical protein
MPFTFEIKKALNVVLFLLKSLGGKAGLYDLFNVLYIAEVKHLLQYGSLITVDDYIAMKNGVVPFNIYSIYRQIKGESYLKHFANNFKEYLAVDNDGNMIAITDYNGEYISVSEANCLFEAIRESKNEQYELAHRGILNSTWEKAGSDNAISPIDMALSAGADGEMIRYIQASKLNEGILLNENNAP